MKEKAKGEKCIHILAMKESDTNAFYIIDSETCPEHIHHHKRVTVWNKGMEVEWFDFCPRCGARLKGAKK